jgi:plastocyanin
MIRLPRTIRLDPSDTLVFERPAEPGEWAVTGSFQFFDVDVPNLTGKARAAFRSGFLGVRSFGFSTLVVVSEASERERDEAIEALAEHLQEKLGAPDMDAARAAAGEEVAFAATLCGHDVNTIIAMHRTWEEGQIKEQFRTLRPRENALPGADSLHAFARAFHFVEADDEPEERVDLAKLMRGAHS